MDSFKKALICKMLAFGLILGAVVGLVCYYIQPQWYPQWYPQILAFFLIIETAIVSYVALVCDKKTDRQLLNTYMLTKVVKIFLALGFVGIYAAVDGTNLKNFVLIFIILYVLFLFFESYLFTQIEKHLKQQKKQ